MQIYERICGKNQKLAQEQCSSDVYMCKLNDGKISIDAVIGWNGGYFLRLTEIFETGYYGTISMLQYL
jgi:hypothetical protein